MEMMCFQSYWFQLKNNTPVFGKKAFAFQKICFRVKVLNTFETFTDYHIKKCRSLKRRAGITYVLSVAFKMKTLKKRVFEC